VTVVYDKKSVKLDDGREITQVVIDSEDADQLPTILRRERARAGLRELNEEELARDVEGILANSRGKIEHPHVKHKIAVDISEYRRGVLKIVYELAWYWLGELFLKDPMAVRLRTAILQSESLPQSLEPHCIRGTITFGANIEPLPLWKDNPNAHIVWVARSRWPTVRR
jgi:hypothetical protein